MGECFFPTMFHRFLGGVIDALAVEAVVSVMAVVAVVAVVAMATVVAIVAVVAMLISVFTFSGSIG